MTWPHRSWWWLSVAAAVFGLLLLLFWLPKPPRLWVSCDQIGVPVRITTPVVGVLLHPRWGNQLVTAAPRVARDAVTYWPGAQTAQGSGYRCEFLNEGEDALSSITLNLEVAYRASTATLPRRTIALSFANPIRSKELFPLYVVDDSGWDPEVVFPVSLLANVGDRASRDALRLHYSTHDGAPYRLIGFGSPRSP